MYRTVILISLLFLSFAAISQKYTPVDAGSKIHFIINNFGIATGGDLSGMKGEINFLPNKITASSFNVSVEVNTIDTDNDTRDKHLKSKEYFNAEKYPQITLTSTGITTTKKTKAGEYYFTGNITMHGVSKIIAFPFVAVKKGDDYLFTGSFSINRLDFAVGRNSAVLSNTVKISLSVLAKKS
jgi:polyisoprenoid-binding protein YceI